MAGRLPAPRRTPAASGRRTRPEGRAAYRDLKLTRQVYGSVVIGQNYVVKKRRLEEYEAQQKAVSRERSPTSEACGIHWALGPRLLE